MNINILKYNIKNEDRDNYDPDIWGGSLWFVLFLIAICYPKNNPSEEIKESAKNFYLSLKVLTPCKKCRINFSGHLLNNPLTDKDLQNRDSLLKWLCNLRNLVNVMQGKKEQDHDEMINYYINLCKNGGLKPNKSNTGLYVLILILICIIGFLVFRKDKA